MFSALVTDLRFHFYQGWLQMCCSFSRPQASLLHTAQQPMVPSKLTGCWERGYLWNLLSMYRSLGWTPHCITGNMAHAYITFGEMEAGETEKLKVTLHPWLGYRNKPSQHNKKTIWKLWFSLVLLRKRGRNDPVVPEGRVALRTTKRQCSTSPESKRTRWSPET